MRRFPVQAFLPILTAAILLGTPSESKALCCLFNWWGAGYGPTYSAYYAPTYTAAYAPTYTAAYWPSTYTAAYAPTYTAAYWPTTYTAAYLPSTSYSVSAGYGAGSACCGVQSSYSAPSCCSPCTSCVSCCAPNCTNCPGGDCGLNSSSSSSPTPAAGSSRQNPTFIDEEDPGMGSGYESPVNPMNQGTEDGFSPRRPGETPDPLDQQFDDKSVNASKTLRFQNPQPVVENLDEKITSRAVSHRTRLVERRSWEQPVVAKNVSRDVPDVNFGWVPVPAPTQLVQK